MGLGFAISAERREQAIPLVKEAPAVGKFLLLWWLNCPRGNRRVPDAQLSPPALEKSRPGRFPRGILFQGPRAVRRVLFAVFLVLFLVSCAGPQKTTPQSLPLAWFRLKAPDAKRVNVVGTFNGWDPEAHPLQGPDGKGVWALGLPLLPGRYRYMFVLDGTRWVTDPNAAASEEDGFGTRNSLLFHGP